MRSRTIKAGIVVGTLALAGGTFLAVGGPAASATVRYHTTGFAAATINDDGSFTATVDGTGSGGATSTTTVTGQLAPGSGIGTRGASGSAALSSDGSSFTSSFVSAQVSPKGPDATGTISGTISPTGTLGTNASYSFSCAVTFPPLAMQCTVSVRWV